MSDLDTCYCGDYRRDHVDGEGRCKLNGLGHGYSGYQCLKFRLAKPAAEARADPIFIAETEISDE